MATALIKGEDGQVAELARARAGLHSLLARVFSAAPTAELLKGVKDPEVLSSLAACGIAFDEEFLSGGVEEQIRELAAEFTRLFIGPGPHIAPFESVFVRSPGEYQPRLWGGATVAVAGFYEEAGLRFHGSQIPDHLGLEFEAMAALARAEAESRESGDREEAGRLLELERRFCREHLLRWAPDLCLAVERETTSGFYRGMAALARTLVMMPGEEDSII